MKIYKLKIKIEIEPMYIYPFGFLVEWYNVIELIVIHIRIKRHFNKLAWTEDKIWKMTMYCGSLNEAIGHLAYKLLSDFGRDEKRFYPVARKLITDGFEREWEC